MRLFFILLKAVALILLVLWKAGAFRWLSNLLARIDPGDEFSYFFNVLANFLLFALAINLLVGFLSGVYRRRQKLTRGRNDNVLAGLENIYILLMSGAVVAVILSLFGVDFQKLFTGVSIVAAAIAIITKEYVANILSGIALSFSKEFSIGDYIHIGEHKGKVMDITLSKTALLNDDDDVVFVPNNFFYLHELVNHSKMGHRTVNVDFEIGIESLGTVDDLEKDLIHSLEEFHENIVDNSFKIRIVDIKKESISMKFQYMLKRTNREVEKEIRKKTVRRVIHHIRKE